MVEKWFAARMQPDQLGTSWNTPGWTKYVVYFRVYYSPFLTCKHRYIDETVVRDRTNFKPIPTVNPFLTDFTAETTEGAGDDNNGDAIAPGAIGSMQGIIGIL
jgi:hypothetical protein